MNFRFSRALPRGIPIRAGQRRERDHLFAYAVTLASLYDCAKKTYKLVTRCREGTFYPDEIEIQEAHSKRRKLDSQAALPHPTRDRAADGLRPKAWSLRASRRDHDPGRLSPRSAGLGGLRPAMAADRDVRGPPARSPRQERDSERAPNPR